MKNLLSKLLVPTLMITGIGCAETAHEHGEDAELHGSNRNPGMIFVDFRDLTGGMDGVAVVNANPFSSDFGEIDDRENLATGALPHHLYWNRAQNRLYTSALGGANAYEIKRYVWDDEPRISRAEAINTLGQKVGEDFYFTEDGLRYYVTFMNGDGSATGGSVVMFDALTNTPLQVISAPKPAVPANGENFIMYPHGISANEARDTLMVTSTIHPDLATGAGNTVTTIDMNTNALKETYLVSEDWNSNSGPVEVIALRDGLPEVALASAMLTGDIWLSSIDPVTGQYGTWRKVIEGDDHGWSWPLEFYVHTNKYGKMELYISFANPGVVAVYEVDDLPNMTLNRVLPAAAGAHHMVFFTSKYGREVLLVNNNLLNLNGLNAGTITAVDVYTGQLLGVIDLPSTYGVMPESIESAWGNGHDYHH